MAKRDNHDEEIDFGEELEDEILEDEADFEEEDVEETEE